MRRHGLEAGSLEDGRTPLPLAGADFDQDMAAGAEDARGHWRQPPERIQAVRASGEGGAGFVVAHFGLELIDLPVRDIGQVRNDSVQGAGREGGQQVACYQLDS